MQCAELWHALRVELIACLQMSELQKELQGTARKFAKEEMAPKAAQYDQSMGAWHVTWSCASVPTALHTHALRVPH